MGKEKIIVDTNILISAIGWEGKPRELFISIIDGKYELVISNKQLAEIRRVLNYPRLGFTKGQRNQFLKILFKIATVKETKTELRIIKEDPSDNMLLECAVEAGAKYVVSGDKHLKKLRKYKEILIIPVNEFLKKEACDFS
ncbi:MAG TPA: putative toxin-antitoxin system toxin component, PIN family [Candidatus Nanoarchaeia archaeon]|nr:putative toxin-antitoxin system toxin component, PIN family [Candidatus Nanoarchaeia archaeon]